MGLVSANGNEAHRPLELKRLREKEICHDYEVVVCGAQGEYFSSLHKIEILMLWGCGRVGAW